jgi:hypothetical protein
LTSTDFDNTVHPVDFGEAATVTSTYRIKATPGFNAGGGVRLWRNLGFGVGVSRFARTSGTAVDAQIPHPFYFGRPRPVSGDASGLKREEIAVDLQAVWMFPVSPRWQVAVSGGPSWFSIRQDLVDDVTVTQSYPYDTAAFSGIASHRAKASRVGFNVGTDITYVLARHVGVGVDVRLARARVRLPASAGTVAVDAGGGRLAGGIRFRF